MLTAHPQREALHNEVHARPYERLSAPMVLSHIGDHFLDEPRYRPIFRTAARLGVPIYLHPTLPHANLIKPFLGYGWALPGPGRRR